MFDSSTTSINNLRRICMRLNLLITAKNFKQQKNCMHSEVFIKILNHTYDYAN